MAYTPVHADWQDAPSEVTPILGSDLEHMETGISDAADDADAANAAIAAHIADTSDAHDASAISIADAALDFTATDVEGALAEIQTDIESLTAGLGNINEIQAVTALPGSPADGDEIMFMDSLTAPTYAWHLKYLAAKASNKWIFIGGSPAMAAVAAAEGKTGATYGALATAGPAIAVPVAGDYDVALETDVALNTTTVEVFMSYTIGGAAAVDADAAAYVGEGGTTRYKFVRRLQRKTGLTAVTLTAQYKSDGTNTTTWRRRLMTVTPVAIGG